jgi:glycerol-1-phosphate dehydrogenase [NAD(P)+]
MADGSSTVQARPVAGPAGGWTALIEDIRQGRWVHPVTGERTRPGPLRRIEIAEDLDGREQELVRAIGFAGTVAVVADEATHAAMGARVARALRARGEVVLDRPHADLGEIVRLAERLRGYDHVVAVGSGTINDLCKYVTARDGRDFAVFATAASMDGYTSTTASITLDSGLKVSLPAHAPAGVFFDLSVIAAAPRRLAAAGFGDSICRPVCQIDWWMSHRLFDTFYTDAPYLIMAADEAEVMARADALGRGDVAATGWLVRLLVLSGLGVAFTGTSHPGSAGEHQISHYVDVFAGARHPGSLHGEQVGAASLVLARLQHWFLAQERPPEIGPTRIDEADMVRRMGPEIGAQCLAEYRKKALDAAAADRLNARLAAIWPELRRECLAMAMPVERMADLLVRAGGAPTAAALGIPADLWRDAIRHGHEMRNRWSFIDLACDAGLLDTFAAEAR